MTRNYKRKTEKKYNFEILLKAVKLVRSGKPICSVAKKNSIPQSTLHSWLIGEHKIFGRGRFPVLNEVEEKTIIDAIDFCNQCGIPVDRNAVRDMVQSYLRSRKKKNPFTNDRPGRDWCILFEKRNGDILSERKLDLVYRGRIKCLTNKTTTFFDNYERVLSLNKLEKNPHRIFNLIEIGLNTKRDCKKLYATKERAKNYLTSSNGSKGMYAVLFCISASGVYLPPYTLYKAKHMLQSWTKGGPHRAAYGLSDSGWMMDKNFENWFVTIFVKFVNHFEKPVLLLYNGYNSHLTYDTVMSAKENQIIILCLPPNTPNALQSPGVGVFSSVKEEWWEIMNSWYHNTENSSVTKTVFPSLLKQLWARLLPALAIEGFKSSGLYPPNRNAKVQEVLVSSDNYFEGFEEFKPPMTNTVTSAPTASPEMEFKEDVLQSPICIYITCPESESELKDDVQSPITDTVTNAPTASPDSELEDDVQLPIPNAVCSAPTASSELELDEKVQSPINKTVTSAPIARPESELKKNVDISHNISLPPSMDLKLAKELNNKRKARFEEIMMQILGEEQTT